MLSILLAHSTSSTGVISMAFRPFIGTVNLYSTLKTSHRQVILGLLGIVSAEVQIFNTITSTRILG